MTENKAADGAPVDESTPPAAEEAILGVDPQIEFLATSANALIKESQRLAGPQRSWIVRIWNAPRALDLLSQAQQLFDACMIKRGEAPLPRPKQLVLTRRIVVTAQWLCGFANGFAFAWSASNGSWGGATLSLTGLLITAAWRIPGTRRVTRCMVHAK